MNEEIVADAPEVVAEAKPEVDPILSALSDDEPTESAETEVTPEESPNNEDVDAENEEETEIQPEAKPEAEQEDNQIDPKEEARRWYEDRQKAREESSQRVKKATDEYIGQAEEDENETRIRTIEADNFARIVESNNKTLVSENEKVKLNPELQIFNPESKEYNSRLHEKAMKDYIKGSLQHDEYGNIVKIKDSLYQHLTETAELFQGAVKSGAFQQVRDQRKTKSNAEPKPAVTPKEAPKDPIMEVLMSD